jgi:8-oxo-dGTP pyrophosphatase MutT (NUDIX family)
MLFLVVSSSDNKNKWVLPKGKIEKKETPEFAAIREVMEETGIEAKPVKKAGYVTYTKRGKRVTAVYFLMQFQAFHNTSSEGRAIAWVAKDEALHRLQHHNARVILESM